MALFYHTRFEIPLVFACLYILFLKKYRVFRGRYPNVNETLIVFYNIEAICEIGNPTNTHSGYLC